jgi:hypothetical protein
MLLVRRKLFLIYWPSLEIRIKETERRAQSGQPVQYLNNLRYGQNLSSSSREPEFVAPTQEINRLPVAVTKISTAFVRLRVFQVAGQDLRSYKDLRSDTWILNVQ